MLLHNIIKMNYVREGYLPNYPYHMISDAEMFNAFLPVGTLPEDTSSLTGYFLDHYPCEYDTLSAEYKELVSALRYHLDKYLKESDEEYQIPNWVYSYMIGEVVGPTSSIPDKHDLLVLMNVDNIDDVMTKEACESCLEISKEWVSKLPPAKNIKRPPTIFGEPHVIKSLRLKAVNVIS